MAAEFQPYHYRNAEPLKISTTFVVFTVLGGAAMVAIGAIGPFTESIIAGICILSGASMIYKFKQIR